MSDPMYPGLASLREALTSDDPDRRGEAYSAVMEQDVKPTAVLESEPSEDALNPLRDAGVLPESREVHPTSAEQNAEVVGLLEDAVSVLETIAENTGGSS